MIDAIQAARELGKAIQQDPRYIRLSTAQKANDDDNALQEQIGRFNVLRGQLNQEVQKEKKDTETIKEMDAEIKELYRDIFDNANMQEFTEARNDIQQMVTFINQIITGSVGGEDPDAIEFQESCGGDCGGCSGCS